MGRIKQVLFVMGLFAAAWYIMMAMHETGHVLAALVTGGSVERVVLHPLAISRTDVAPNPHPAFVVWAGPIVGCLVPLILFAVVPRRLSVQRRLAGFLAGFCLVANGAYIGGGCWDRVGDCAKMLRYGTPLWLLPTFGLVAVATGLLIWHRLGSPRDFLRNPALMKPHWLCMLYVTLTAYVIAVGLLFP